MLTAAETVLAPLDALRTRALGAARPLSGRLAADRRSRVLWLGLSSVLVSFALTAWSPALLLAYGPLLLGVPHLLSDVRYLVLQPALHRRFRLVALSLPGLLLCATSWWIPHGMALGVGLLLSGVSIAANASPLRRSIALAASITAGALLWTLEPWSLVALAHLHNLVALLIWWRLRPRDRRMLAIPATVILGTLAIALGAVGMDARLTTSFAFLQSVHYAIWLRLVPEDMRARETPRSFRATWRGLASEFGPIPLLFTVALAASFLAGGLVDVSASGAAYFRLAAFHGPLEFGVLLLTFLEDRRP